LLLPPYYYIFIPYMKVQRFAWVPERFDEEEREMMKRRIQGGEAETSKWAGRPPETQSGGLCGWWALGTRGAPLTRGGVLGARARQNGLHGRPPGPPLPYPGGAQRVSEGRPWWPPGGLPSPFYVPWPWRGGATRSPGARPWRSPCPLCLLNIARAACTLALFARLPLSRSVDHLRKFLA
jgi:hypothetical protein